MRRDPRQASRSQAEYASSTAPPLLRASCLDGEAQGRLSAKSETAGAIRYALARWLALSRYADDGFLEIDNSAAERALRAVALGRKLPFPQIRMAVQSEPLRCTR
jgi:hypothetical protein